MDVLHLSGKTSKKGTEVVREPGGTLVVTDVMLFATAGGLFLLPYIDINADGMTL